MTYNAADTRAIRAAQKAARTRQIEDDGVILSIMGSPSGRRWVWELLGRAHIFSTCFTPDALAMAFAEGERNIGLQLLSALMRAAPDQYIQMMREAQDRSIADGRRTDSGYQRSDAERGRPDSGRPDDADGSGSAEDGYDTGFGNDASNRD